jgi:hypothetical protein
MSAPDDDLGVGKRKREKESKHGGLAAAQEAAKKGISALDQLELEEQDDVYDLVDDEEYEQIVEKRREEGDFVVDDGTTFRFLPSHNFSIHPSLFHTLTSSFPLSLLSPSLSSLLRGYWIPRRWRGSFGYFGGPV